MTEQRKFEKLLSPFQIKGVKLQNRMIKAPQAMLYADKEGYITEKVIGFYESLARGGVGMIVIGALTPVSTPFGLDFISCWDDKYLPGLTDLVQTIHKFGPPVFGQIDHLGPGAMAKNTGIQPLSSSSLSAEELPSPIFAPPRGVTLDEIKEIVDKHAEASERAKRAGFDGVEVHACHCYFLASFLSRIWNKRDDQYGCQTLENRARIVVEIIQAIKNRLGQDYPVGVRINGEEWGAENALTSEESQGIAKLLEKAGADYLHVAGYGYGPRPWRFVPDQWLYPEPTKDMKPFVKRHAETRVFIPAAAAIKKVVSVPVIGVGNLGPELGERLLEEGKIDLVALGRLLWADPELPRKVAEGRLEDIAPCTHCATCQSYATKEVPYRRCRINAAMGYEKDLAPYNWKVPEKKKKVLVVGGGPGGIEAARVAALRGHDVTLYEKEPGLGGLVPLAAMVKGLDIEDLPAMVRYLSTQITKAGVKVVLGRKVDSALLEQFKPDAVVLAVGGRLTVPDIPGIKGQNVVSSADLHRKVKKPLRLFGPKLLRRLTGLYLPVGERVVILGGLMEGCETAEFLVKRGRKVTIVEESDQLGKRISQGYIERLLPWLQDKGVHSYTCARYEEVTDKGLTITTKEGNKLTIEADTVLVVRSPEPNTELYDAVKEKVPEVYLVGPARGADTSLIADAVADGRRAGCAI